MSLPTLLTQTLSPNAETRNTAERTLSALRPSPNFLSLLLQIGTLEALVYLKNTMTWGWSERININEQEFIPELIETLIKGGKGQKVVGECCAIVAARDGEGKIVEAISQKLNPQDFNANTGVLQAAHAIFKRYRAEYRSDELFTEINSVLAVFCPPFLELFKATDALISQNQDNKQNLEVLLSTLHLMCKIFYSLNIQDLPAFFEDHMVEFMDILHRYLVFDAPILRSSDDEPGIMELVKESICQIIGLYAQRYEEEFKQLPLFVSTIWTLLTNAGLEQRTDGLVSEAINILATVSRLERQSHLFTTEGTLTTIAEKVIIPNMQLRESDIEMFEDEPLDYLRKDLERSDTDTRRRASSDLLRSMMINFKTQLTPMFSNYVAQYLKHYAENPRENWRHKDTAIYLIISLASEGQGTAEHGSLKASDIVNIPDFFSQNIFADLQSEGNSVHPILKLDAIKYLYSFRSQLSKEHLVAVLPHLITHLAAPQCAVYTYAAVCIERILYLRSGNAPMLSSGDISPMLESVLTNLFKLLTSTSSAEKLAENDYIVQALMRTLLVAKEAILPYAMTILESLASILHSISSNPSNPKFNHFVFECLGASISNVCNTNTEYVAKFEAVLLPIFQQILSQELPEFSPYVFQLMTLLLNSHPAGEIPLTYRNLLPMILQPAAWENYGNIPALVGFLGATLQKDPAYVVTTNTLGAYLGIFQKLIASKANDQYGFELLGCIVTAMPITVIQPFFKQIWMILVTRLQSSKTPKYTKGFIQFSTDFINRVDSPKGQDHFIASLEEIQPGLVLPLLQNVILKELKPFEGKADRQNISLAFIKLLSHPKLIGDPACWVSLASTALQLAQGSKVNREEEAIDDRALLLEEAGYQSSYAKLRSVGKSGTNQLRAALPQDPIETLRHAMTKLMPTVPQLSEMLRQCGQPMADVLG